MKVVYNIIYNLDVVDDKENIDIEMLLMFVYSF